MPQEIASHLARFQAAKEARRREEAAAAAEQSAALSVMARNLVSRMRAEALPCLESAAEDIRAAGYHAVVTTGEAPGGGPAPWTILLSLKFECGTHNLPRAIVDVSFLAEIDDSQDAWRVRSFFVGAQGGDDIYLPGSSRTLESFVKEKLGIAVSKAFPV